MLLNALKNIPDRRRKQAKKYDQEHILYFTVLGMLSGASSYREVEGFVRNRFKLLKKNIN